MADPESIERGDLWIRRPDGSLINMLEDIAAFDAAVMEYVWFPDRSKWSVYERMAVIEQAKKLIPVVRIAPEDLSEEQLVRLAELLEKHKEEAA